MRRHVDIFFQPIHERQSSKSTQLSLQLSDGVYQYACETSSIGLLLMEFIYAIKEGDGSRIIRCWKYLLPIFQATKRNNYTCEAFTLLIDVNYLLSPRMAHQRKWSRTVNMHGLPGQNVSCDLHMEHMNWDWDQMSLIGLLNVLASVLAD